VTVVDAHTHFIPESLGEEASRRPEWGIEIERRDGERWVSHEQGFAYPLDETFFGGEAKLADMDTRGIDTSVMSISPTLFFYWIGAGDAASFARYANDALAETVRRSDGRLAGVATLPMQDPEAAATELRRAVEELSLRGAHIGTTVEGGYLDDARFAPLLEAADALRVPLIVHPYYVGPLPRLEQFYLTNLFGNPLDTALCAARLIFSGVFEQFPNLTVMLVHAGGFLPYQIGRLDHGWTVRPEPRVQLQRKPSEYLDRFFYDTISHHDSALAWLLELVGDERVVLGTDLPYDMADQDPVGRVDRLPLAAESRERVAGANATQLFGVPAATAAGATDDLEAAREGG
jgi:aminocarboxymuconate-semialdehyde decarboxylase